MRRLSSVPSRYPIAIAGAHAPQTMRFINSFCLITEIRSDSNPWLVLCLCGYSDNYTSDD